MRYSKLGIRSGRQIVTHTHTRARTHTHTHTHTHCDSLGEGKMEWKSPSLEVDCPTCYDNKVLFLLRERLTITWRSEGRLL